jgi:hypothetical protein
MKTYKVTGFIHGVWSTITIKTIAECITARAAELGMTEVTYVEVN